MEISDKQNIEPHLIYNRTGVHGGKYEDDCSGL